MNLLWAVGPVAMTVGAALALVQLRGIAASAVDLQQELRRFSEVQVAVAGVRRSAATGRVTRRR
jgi:hypothetical protein